ncbi:MAG: type II and III secretion system protein family protein [Hyphomicrobiaceae bacterium]
MEADRRAARDLGLAWNSRTGRFIGLTGFVPGVGGLASGAVPVGQFVARLLDSGNTADVIVEALEKKGLARRLAEPNLVALSGDTASFLAGGEFPFPVQADDRRITIEFKKFGVGLAFTPTVLDNGQINLKIEPEVSDIDENNILQLNNVTVPGLVVRRANTTVELRDGQSFAIAGLLQTKHKKNVHQLPWIGQVPVLGTLFRSSSYEKQESDLVIIVTPRLVQPVSPGNVRLKTPLDNSLASNDRDFFLRGKSEIKKHWISLFGHMLPGDGEWVTEVQDTGVRHGGRPNASYK